MTTPPTTQLPVFTLQDIRYWGPCYDPGKYAPEDWSGTALDVLRSEQIPADDRLWVVLRQQCISEPLARLYARRCALAVAHLWDCPPVMREYLETGNKDLAAAARVAARASAQADAQADARASAWYATAADAQDDAQDDAWCSAWYDAWYAAHVAARASAQADKIIMLIEILEGAQK